MLPKYGHARQGILMHNLRLLLLTLTFLLARISSATELKPSTIAAFDHYVELAEQRMKNEVRSGPFLSVDGLPIAQREGGYSQLKQGVILTHALEITDHGNAIGVPDGLIDHWVGTAFIPGVTLEQTVTLLHDYKNHWKIFAPEVVRSRLLQGNGKDFKSPYACARRQSSLSPWIPPIRSIMWRWITSALIALLTARRLRRSNMPGNPTNT